MDFNDLASGSHNCIDDLFRILNPDVCFCSDVCMQA
jgi:hypothetical protein